MHTVNLPRSVLELMTRQLKAATACLAELGLSPGQTPHTADELIAVVGPHRRHVFDRRAAEATAALASKALSRRAPSPPAASAAIIPLRRAPMAPSITEFPVLPPAPGVSPAVRRKLQEALGRREGPIV